MAQRIDVSGGGGGAQGVMQLLLMLEQLEEGRAQRAAEADERRAEREENKRRFEIEQAEKRRAEMFGMFSALKAEKNADGNPRYSDKQLDEIMNRQFPGEWRSFSATAEAKPPVPTPPVRVGGAFSDENPIFEFGKGAVDAASSIIRGDELSPADSERPEEAAAERRRAGAFVEPILEGRQPGAIEGGLNRLLGTEQSDFPIASAPASANLLRLAGQEGGLNLESGINSALLSGRSPEQIATSMSRQLGVPPQELLQLVREVGRGQMNPNALDLPAI